MEAHTDGRGHEPTATELRAFIDEGGTQIQAAEHWQIGRSRVQRILKAGEDDRGPTERLVAEMVATWGDVDAKKAVQARTLLNYAIMADRGCVMGSGAAMAAGVQANTRLDLMLEKLGLASGVENLREVLLRDE